MIICVRLSREVSCQTGKQERPLTPFRLENLCKNLKACEKVRNKVDRVFRSSPRVGGGLGSSPCREVLQAAGVEWFAELIKVSPQLDC